MKINLGERCTGQSPGGFQTWSFQMSSIFGVADDISSSWQPCVTMKYGQPGKPIQALSPEFLLGLYHVGMTDCPWGSSTSSPSRSELTPQDPKAILPPPPYIALLVWLKALIPSHCSYLAGPRPPGKQRHSSVT